MDLTTVVQTPIINYEVQWEDSGLAGNKFEYIMPVAMDDHETHLGSVIIKRAQLLSGKKNAWTMFVERFLISTGFNTTHGQQLMNELMASHDIQYEDDSVLAFLHNIAGEYVGLLAFQTGSDTYKFTLVSGSKDEIQRMQ